jgi:hypothetical protein
MTPTDYKSDVIPITSCVISTLFQPPFLECKLFSSSAVAYKKPTLVSDSQPFSRKANKGPI